MLRNVRTACVLLVATILLVVPGSAIAEQEAETIFYETREDIPERYRWNLDDIFGSLDDWAEASAAVEKRLPDLAAFQGRLAESPEVLADALDLRFEIERTVDDLYVYAGQWQRTDTRLDDANDHGRE